VGVTGGDLDRRDTGVGRERVRRREPRRVSGSTDQPHCGDRTDAVDLVQPRAVLIERSTHPLLDVTQQRINGAKIANQISGELLASPLAHRCWPHRAQHRRRSLRRDRQRRATGDQNAQHRMELVRDPNQLRSKVRATFLEHREHRPVILAGNKRHVILQRCDARGGSCVDQIGLAPATPRQLTHPRRRCARHIQHHFLASNRPLGEMTTKATRVLDRPPPCGNCFAQLSIWR
jgi:hypothetical protein